MTRSLTIVNTSNWNHEDYSIVVREDDQTFELKSGDSFTIHPYAEVTLVVCPLSPEKEVPHRTEDGVQLIPEARVAWRKCE